MYQLFYGSQLISTFRARSRIGAIRQVKRWNVMWSHIIGPDGREFNEFYLK